MFSFLNWINMQIEAYKLGSYEHDEQYFRKSPEDITYTGSNQANILIHKNYSGSGPQAFGGASEWGHITLSIALPPEISNEQGQLLLRELREVLANHNYKKER